MINSQIRRPHSHSAALMASNTKLILALFGLLITTATVATGYTNHTVGGYAGWFFHSKTNTSATNYTSWAANQTFSLGDCLIFRTTTNQTVIQTYNETTYRNCTTDDASDTDTFQYNGGNTDFDQSLTIEVPLTIEGANYYFSDAGDGVQCQRGMAFKILVRHGNGLPPSLNQPPPPPYGWTRDRPSNGMRVAHCRNLGEMACGLSVIYPLQLTLRDAPFTGPSGQNCLYSIGDKGDRAGQSTT
ncbi:hypothetical protein V6Z11_D07G162300 [Gossypium hirsutum]